MKKQNNLLLLTLVLATLVGLYVVPRLIKLATFTPDDYPFLQYSSGLKELVVMDFGNEEFPVSSPKTSKRYTEHQADSLLPIFNFYQLTSKGLQPDSIEGVEVSMPIIRSGSVVYRHNPDGYNSRKESLYTMFESMPRRGGLKVPEDVFRFSDRIEFIDAQTNSVNIQKSALFQDLLDSRGFSFPSQWNVGNPNPRKAYDEGYFSLDSDGRLFHIKMVNGRPYVRDTKVSDNIDIAHFDIYEAGNKRFYGFVYSTDGGVYILEEGYHLLKLDIPTFDINSQQMLVMGNILYWTIAITNSDGKEFYALRTDDLTQVDHYSVERTLTTWDSAQEYLLPLSITFLDRNSGWFYPRFRSGGVISFGFSILLSLLYFFISRKGSSQEKILKSILIALTGIPALLASILLPPTKKNINK